MRFSDIPGHSAVKARLRAMVDDNMLPHALLLEGSSGTGKFALARALAQYIHCTNRQGGDACGVCSACVQHQKFNHIDTFFSFPVIKKNSKPTTSDDFATEFRQLMTENYFMDFEQWLIKLGNINAQPAIYVEEAAELLRRTTLTARSSRYKIVLMWLPERMNEETANKLLKLVEEPYPDTLFIMSSDTPRNILPTIYSRTQRVRVNRYEDEEVAEILRAIEPQTSPEQAQAIASISQGDVTKALSLARDDQDRRERLDLFMQLMRNAWQRKVGELKQWSNRIADLGREGQMKFYDYASHLVRENFINNLHVSELNAMVPDEADFSFKFSRFINERNVEDLLALFDSAHTDTAGNGNAKIIAFDTAVKTIILLRK